MRVKRIFSLIVIVLMMVSLFTGYHSKKVDAERIYMNIKEGTWGNLTWKIDTDTKTMVISGSGPMNDFSGPHGGWHRSMYYSEVETIIISDGITCIGEGAFWEWPADNVYIPNSVTEIKDNAFYESGIDTIDIPNSVTKIGQGAFEFSGLKKIDLPNSITEIGGACFKYCNSLKEVKWPTNASTIKWSTFCFSSNIQLTIPNTVKTIEDGAFKYAEKMSFNYLGTIDDWCNIKFEGKDSNPIIQTKKMISNGQTIKKAVFGNKVKEINDNAFYSCNSFTEVSFSNSLTRIGKYAFGLNSNLQKVTIPGSVSLVDEGAFYYCGKLFNLELKDGIKEIGKYALYYLSSDLIREHKLNVNIPLSVSTIGGCAFENENLSNITVNNPECDIQNGAIIDHSYVTLYGWWHSTAEEYAKDTEIKFVAMGYNNTQYVKTESSNDRMKIVTKPKITVPKKVPFVGGSTLKLDYAGALVKFVRKGNTYKLAIGANLEDDTPESQWKDFKKMVESKGLKKWKEKCQPLMGDAFGSATVGPKINGETNIYGYAEGTISSKGIETIKGGVIIEIKAKASTEAQVMVVYVPVVLKASLEVGVKTDLGVQMDFNKQQVYFDGVLDITMPKIKVSCGIGLAYVADISTYGSIEHKMSFPCSTNKDKNGKIKGTVTGEMGVSAKLLFASYEKCLWKGTWDYTNDESSIEYEDYDDDDEDYDEDYDDEKSWLKSKLSDDEEWEKDDAQPSTWTGAMSETYTNNYNNNILQSKVYQSSNPQLLELEDGTKIMTYIAVVGGRGEANKYAAVYSVCKKDSNQWSEPAIINDDETADFNVKATSYKGKVYFVYNDFKNKLSDDFLEENMNSKEEAKMCGIETAELDISTNKVKTYQVASDHYCYNPSIYLNNNTDSGELNIGYCENANDDMLELSGKNKIHVGVVTDEWQEKNCIDVSAPISDFEIGMVGDCEEALIAYTITGKESKLQIIDYDGEEKFNYKTLSFIDNLKFEIIDNNKSLLWNSSGYHSYYLEYTDDLEYSSTLLREEGECVDFDVLNYDENDKLICSIVGDDNNSNVCVYDVDFGYVYDSSPTKVLEKKGKIEKLSVVDNDEAIMLMYNNTQSTDDEDYKTNTDLYVSNVKKDSNISIDDIDYCESDFFPGSKASIDVAVRNNGLSRCNDDIKIDVFYNGQSILSNNYYLYYLGSGAYDTKQIDLNLPENIAEKGEYTVKVSVNGSVVDTKTIIAGSPDLELSTKEENTNITATITNVGGFDTNCSLLVFDENDSKLLKEDIGVIKAGESFNKTYNKNDFDAENIVFSIKASDDEQFKSNNTVSVYNGQDELKTLKGVEVSKTKIYYKKNEELNVSDLKVFAIYTDETKEEVHNYTTNAKKIDMSTYGVKELKVSYEEVGRKCIVPVPIVIKDNTKASSNNVTNKRIAPKRVSFKKVKKLKRRAVKLIWGKVNKVGGYHILYALNKKFTKKKKSKFVKSQSTSAKVKGLKKKTYYFKIRAYTIWNSKKIYGKWSKIKKIKIKK